MSFWTLRRAVHCDVFGKQTVMALKWSLEPCVCKSAKPPFSRLSWTQMANYRPIQADCVIVSGSSELFLSIVLLGLSYRLKGNSRMI